MEWAEIDSLIWLFVILTLLRWAAKSFVGWGMTRGWISQDFGHGIQNVLA